MDYRGIVTQGYHIDAGGQTAIKIITQGYIGIIISISAAIPYRYGEIKYGSGYRWGQQAEIYTSEAMVSIAYSSETITTPTYAGESVITPTYMEE